MPQVSSSSADEDETTACGSDAQLFFCPSDKITTEEIFSIHGW